MKIAQEVNTQRALTIAGSVALLAITAYGVWKWNQTDLPPSNEDDDKKKKSAASSHGNNNRQVNNDKVEKQSQKVEKVTQIEVEETKEQEIITLKEIKETIGSNQQVVIEATTGTIATIGKDGLEEEIKKELEQVISDIKEEDEEYVVVAKQEEKPTTTATVAEENHSCATSSTDDTDIWTPEHEITSNDEVDHKKNTPEATTTTTTTATTEEYIWKADAGAVPVATAKEEEKSSEEWAAATTAVASAAVEDNTASAPVITTTTTPTSTSKPLSLSAPVFVPRQLVQTQPKKNTKKRLSRAELIEQQRQNHTPHAKARCSHWPRCTNKNCKFWHPFRDCREGENCPFGNKCMFIHPSDYLEPPRTTTRKNHSSDEEDQGQYIHNNNEQQFQFTS